MSNSVTVVAETGGSTGLPLDFALEQNYPNPFNPATTIAFAIYASGASQVASLTIHNLLGQKLRTLVNRTLAAGSYIAVWDGKDEQQRQVPSGVYFYRLRVGDRVSTRTMTLAK